MTNHTQKNHLGTPNIASKTRSSSAAEGHWFPRCPSPRGLESVSWPLQSASVAALLRLGKNLAKSWENKVVSPRKPSEIIGNPSEIIKKPSENHRTTSTWGFCRAKSGFWGPRPLQNEEPATNLARAFLYKIKAPNPFFLVHSCDFQNHWPLQSGEPDMRTHLSRIATWNKASSQKYKDPFCRGVM